ncbi:MAG: methylated-DNA--[protein]-cysteine S-methyltransferase [Anaerolineae bacterium]|nr:methylated-DNA--[protein]-cysteine S-methyltransferase [Anaerolineae bacterium]
MADELIANVFEVEGWGWVGLVASERGLRALVLPRKTSEETLDELRKHYRDVRLAPDEPQLAEAERQVRAYLAGELREFNVPVDLRGNTSFALSVWSAATRIGYGETRAYRWIADQIGGGGAGIYQAVGMALGSNPVPLVIPCHRVVGSDGSMHGYAGGLDMKVRLLAMESGQGSLAF